MPKEVISVNNGKVKIDYISVLVPLFKSRYGMDSQYYKVNDKPPFHVTLSPYSPNKWTTLWHAIKGIFTK